MSGPEVTNEILLSNLHRLHSWRLDVRMLKQTTSHEGLHFSSHRILHVQEALDVIRLALEKYKHPSGMLSSPKPNLDNDNPVLQLAVFAALTRRLLGSVPDELKAWCQEALDVSRKSKAIWHRSPEHGAAVLNSHDNYAAIAVLESLGCGEPAEEICQVGELTGYVFDNRDVRPEYGQDIKAARQLGDIALYKICCNQPRIPNLVEMIWLTVGLLILAFKPMHFHHHLGWLRLEGLRIRLSERIYRKDLILVNICSFLAIAAYDLSMQIRYKSRFSAVFRYYSSDDGHPIRQLVKLLDQRAS